MHQVNMAGRTHSFHALHVLVVGINISKCLVFLWCERYLARGLQKKKFGESSEADWFIIGLKKNCSSWGGIEIEPRNISFNN